MTSPLRWAIAIATVSTLSVFFVAFGERPGQTGRAEGVLTPPSLYNGCVAGEAQALTDDLEHGNSQAETTFASSMLGQQCAAMFRAQPGDAEMVLDEAINRLPADLRQKLGDNAQMGARSLYEFTYGAASIK